MDRWHFCVCVCAYYSVSLPPLTHMQSLYTNTQKHRWTKHTHILYIHTHRSRNSNRNCWHRFPHLLLLSALAYPWRERGRAQSFLTVKENSSKDACGRLYSNCFPNTGWWFVLDRHILMGFKTCSPPSVWNGMALVKDQTPFSAALENNQLNQLKTGQFLCIVCWPWSCLKKRPSPSAM